jgi:hypothetical protein
MLSSTRRRVRSEIDRLPLSTYDTVLGDTLACLATCAIVTMAPVRAGGCRTVCQYRKSSRLSKRFDGAKSNPAQARAQAPLRLAQLGLDDYSGLCEVRERGRRCRSASTPVVRSLQGGPSWPSTHPDFIASPALGPI